MEENKKQDLLAKTKQMRILALEMGKKAPLGAHFGAAFSSMEIFSCLYGGVLNYRPGDPVSTRDIFIVGKGHCVLAYYAALAVYGYISPSLLDTFEENGSVLQGHPILNEEIGIEFSSGSLGMALSQGVGLALSRKKKLSSSHIFVLLGDGECQEGAIWEAAMSASHYHLDNLTVIIDRNHLQYDGNTETVMSLESLSEKWRSFGFEVTEQNGHDIESVYKTLWTYKNSRSQKPTCLIANTVKGKGISFMENDRSWHNKRMTDDEYRQAKKELEDSNGS